MSLIPFKWPCLWVDGAPGLDKLLTDWAVGTWGMDPGLARGGMCPQRTHRRPGLDVSSDPNQRPVPSPVLVPHKERLRQQYQTGNRVAWLLTSRACISEAPSSRPAWGHLSVEGTGAVHTLVQMQARHGHPTLFFLPAQPKQTLCWTPPCRELPQRWLSCACCPGMRTFTVPALVWGGRELWPKWKRGVWEGGHCARGVLSRNSWGDGEVNESLKNQALP